MLAAAEADMAKPGPLCASAAPFLPPVRAAMRRIQNAHVCVNPRCPRRSFFGRIVNDHIQLTPLCCLLPSISLRLDAAPLLTRAMHAHLGVVRRAMAGISQVSAARIRCRGGRAKLRGELKHPALRFLPLTLLPPLTPIRLTWPSPLRFNLPHLFPHFPPPGCQGPIPGSRSALVGPGPGCGGGHGGGEPEVQPRPARPSAPGL